MNLLICPPRLRRELLVDCHLKKRFVLLIMEYGPILCILFSLIFLFDIFLCSQELAELVHKVHLLCLLARGRMIDKACNDPLIQVKL